MRHVLRRVSRGLLGFYGFLFVCFFTLLFLFVIFLLFETLFYKILLQLCSEQPEGRREHGVSSAPQPPINSPTHSNIIPTDYASRSLLYLIVDLNACPCHYRSGVTLCD